MPRFLTFIFTVLLSLSFLSCGESPETGTQVTPFQSFFKESIILKGEEGFGTWEACFEDVVLGSDEKLTLGFEARINSSTVMGNYPVMRLRVNNRDVTADQMVWDGPRNGSDLPCYRFPQVDPDACHRIPFPSFKAKLTCYDENDEIFAVYEREAPYENLFLLTYSPDFESHMKEEIADDMVLPFDSHGGGVQPNPWFVGDGVNPYEFEFEIPSSWISEREELCLFLTNPVHEHPQYWQCRIVMGTHPITDDPVAQGDIMIRDLYLKRTKR